MVVTSPVALVMIDDADGSVNGVMALFMVAKIVYANSSAGI